VRARRGPDPLAVGRSGSPDEIHRGRGRAGGRPGARHGAGRGGPDARRPGRPLSRRGGGRECLGTTARSSPDGQAWAPLSAATVRRKGHPVCLDGELVRRANVVGAGRGGRGGDRAASPGAPGCGIQGRGAQYEGAMGPEEAPDALVHAEPEGPADRPLRGTPAEQEWLKSKVHDLHRAGLTQRSLAATLNVSLGHVNKVGSWGQTRAQPLDGRIRRHSAGWR
jgi:hypothetical protein